jgi:AcrR family transcriptional regulator
LSLVTRKLALKARATRMAETRRRIVHAAYDLHRSVGPARTTISAIAARAGVQRHTVYQHFPNELELAAACTEYGLSLDPQPDPAELATIRDPYERLRTALDQQYGYYRRNEALLANTLRDAPQMQEQLQAAGNDLDALPEIVQRFFAQPIMLRDALMGGWSVPDARADHLRAAIGLAIDFRTWQVLTREQGMTDEQAVGLMFAFVRCLAIPPADGDDA